MWFSYLFHSRRWCSSVLMKFEEQSQMIAPQLTRSMRPNKSAKKHLTISIVFESSVMISYQLRTELTLGSFYELQTLSTVLFRNCCWHYRYQTGCPKLDKNLVPLMSVAKRPIGSRPGRSILHLWLICFFKHACVRVDFAKGVKPENSETKYVRIAYVVGHAIIALSRLLNWQSFRLKS